MSTSNYSENPHFDKTRDRVLADWLTTVDNASIALSIWRSYLLVWKEQGVSPSDDEFLAIFSDLASAGLMEWASAQIADIDLLRAILTGGE